MLHALGLGLEEAPRLSQPALRGRELVFRYNEPSIAEAIRLLEESTGLDPQFAGAWAALAMAHAERGVWGTGVATTAAARS